MPDEKRDPSAPSEEQSPAVYAGPLKRVWAWVGVVYMLVLTALVTYALSFGAYLHGIGGLLVSPALGGTAATLVMLWRQRRSHSPLQSALFLGTLGLCAALLVLGLISGVTGLVENFGVR